MKTGVAAVALAASALLATAPLMHSQVIVLDKTAQRATFAVVRLKDFGILAEMIAVTFVSITLAEGMEKSR